MAVLDTDYGCGDLGIEFYDAVDGWSLDVDLFSFDQASSTSYFTILK